MNTNDLEKNKITLLKKADFLDLNKNLSFKNQLKNMKIDELRDYFKITHLINGKYKDMRGNCFKCLTPLRADYTHHKNYCMDC
jgi:hypothetical protein